MDWLYSNNLCGVMSRGRLKFYVPWQQYICYNGFVRAENLYLWRLRMSFCESLLNRCLEPVFNKLSHAFSADHSAAPPLFVSFPCLAFQAMSSESFLDWRKIRLENPHNHWRLLNTGSKFSTQPHIFSYLIPHNMRPTKFRIISRLHFYRFHQNMILNFLCSHFF